LFDTLLNHRCELKNILFQQVTSPIGQP
jgi:hypothetical protein